MKIILALILLINTQLIAQVAISTDNSTADAGAMLHIKSTTKGLLIPRMTSIQRAAINPAPEGLIVYQTDGVSGFYFNASTLPGLANWKQLITPTDQYWFKNGNDIYTNNSVTGNVGIGSVPTQAGLVVDRKVGAVNAMFGTNTTGVAIESSYPGIAFNTFYNAGRKFIANGYGSLVGLNPDNGNMSFWVTPAAGTSGNAAGLIEAMTIRADGRIGIKNSAPAYPFTITANGDGYVHMNSAGAAVGTYVGADGGTLQTFSNHPLMFATNNSQAQMTLGTNGKLGIGTLPDNTAMLTVYSTTEGLMHTNNTVQVGTYLTAGSASIKTFTNHALRFSTNNRDGDMSIQTNGNVSIGTMGGSAKLNVSAVATTGLEVSSESVALKAIGMNNGTAVEIAGALKVSGISKPAYVLTASATNLYGGDESGPFPGGVNDTQYGWYLRIDNALCNNDPNAMIIATPRTYMRTFMTRYYNGYWYLVVDWAIPAGSMNFFAPSCNGCQPFERSVIAGSTKYLQVGEQFNIIIIKQ